MTWGVVAVGSTAVTGALGMKASGDAADAQVSAAKRGTKAQLRMYEQSRKDQMPWLQGGEKGLNELAAMLGLPGYEGTDWQKDPGYEFQRDEGQKAIDRSFAARGNLLSGAALKAATRFNQDYASDAFGKRFSRLASVAGIGQSAADRNSGSAMETGRSLNENITGAGNARASGYMGAANALTSAIGQGANLYGDYKALDAYQQANKLGKYKV